MLSNGVVTNRDAWVYNYSKQELEVNCRSMIDFFNSEIERLEEYKTKKGEILYWTLLLEKTRPKLVGVEIVGRVLLSD